MEGYRHYIRMDLNGIVVSGFTSGFLKESGGNEEILLGDLPLPGYDGRHFQLNLYTERMQFKYKIVDGQMVERSQAELDAEWAARPVPPKTAEQKKMDKLTADNEQLNLQIIELFEQLVEKGVL